MIQDIEKCVRRSGKWDFSQMQLFALENLGFGTSFDRRTNHVCKYGFGSVRITANSFVVDAWELDIKVRYFKYFQSALNYVKKIDGVK